MATRRVGQRLTIRLATCRILAPASASQGSQDHRIGAGLVVDVGALAVAVEDRDGFGRVVNGCKGVRRHGRTRRPLAGLDGGRPGGSWLRAAGRGGGMCARGGAAKPAVGDVARSRRARFARRPSAPRNDQISGSFAARTVLAGMSAPRKCAAWSSLILPEWTPHRYHRCSTVLGSDPGSLQARSAVCSATLLAVSQQQKEQEDTVRADIAPGKGVDAVRQGLWQPVEQVGSQSPGRS
jgi:hypothetical protein